MMDTNSGPAAANQGEEGAQPAAGSGRLAPSAYDVEQQLAELENIYRTAPIGLLFLDTNLRYVRINEKAAAINGVPVAAHIGRTIWEVLPEIADVVAPDYRQVISSGEPIIDKEVRGRTKADLDVEHVYLVSYFPVKDLSGRVGGVTAVVQDITLQREIEAALRQSERRFALFMQNLPGAAWMKDLEGRYVYANREAERIFQTPLATLRGKRDEQVFAAEVAAQFRANDRLAISGGRAIQTIESLPQPDGVHDSVVVKFPISDDEGNPLLIGVVAFDVTEQRKAEETARQTTEKLLLSNQALLRSNEELRAIQQQLHLITSNMAAAVTRCSRDFRYVWVSQGYAAWIGKPAEEIAGRPIRDVLGDRGYEDIRPYMERVLTGVRVEHTTEVNFLGPGKRWIHAVYVPTYAEETAVDGWVAVVTDITEERRITEQLRDQVQLLDLTQDAVLSMRWDGVIEFWNRGAEERYGWRREEAIGQVAHDLLGTEFPEPLPEIQRKLAQDSYWQGELVHTKREGGRIVVASRSALRRDVENRPCGYLEITTDITERKRAEELRRQSQRLESLGVLAGGIAHDFNNLLVGILGNASLALDVLGADTPAKRMLEDVIGASERAAALTRQLLAYAGKEELATRPFELSKLVKELGRLLRASIPRNVHLTLDSQDGLPYVDGDPTQLQQVVMNLVINAAEAIPEGAPGIVTIATAYRKSTASEQADAIIPLPSADQSYVVLTIADTGTGITPDIRSRIFDPFYTTKFAGRGLGLSAVLGIVKAHRGAISLQTGPGSGTTFTVLLPARTGPVQPEVQVRSQSVRGNGTILVIDDEPTVRAVAERTLHQSGYRVLLAENGRQGIDLVAAHAEIVAVVLDLAMPVMTGDQALPELRRLRPDLPVILSSGYSEIEARRRLSTAGVTAFLQKPYKAATLIEAVSACFTST